MSIDPTRYVEVSANGTPNDPQATADLAAAAQAGAVAGDIAGRAAGAEAGAASGTEVASAAGAAAGAAAGELAGTAAGTASGATAGAVAGASAGGPAGAAAATALLNARSITGGGLATGGGTLAADRVITVTAATQEEAEAGAATTVAMTPRRWLDAFTSRTSALTRTLLGLTTTLAFSSGIGVPSYQNRTDAAVSFVLGTVTRLRQLDIDTQYVRMSLTDIVNLGVPAVSYFRTTDRYLPNGSIDNTNGGYWMVDPRQHVRIEALGAAGNGTTNDSLALVAWIMFGSLTGAYMTLTPGNTYRHATELLAPREVGSFPLTLDGNGGTLLMEKNLNITGTRTPFLTTTLAADVARGQSFLKLTAITGPGGTVEPGDLLVVRSPAIMYDVGGVKIDADHTYWATDIDPGLNVYFQGTALADITKQQVIASGRTGDIVVEVYKLVAPFVFKNLRMESVDPTGVGAGISIQGQAIRFEFASTRGKTRAHIGHSFTPIAQFTAPIADEYGYMEGGQYYDSTPEDPGGFAYGYAIVSGYTWLRQILGGAFLRGWHGTDTAQGVMRDEVTASYFARNAFGVSGHEGTWETSTRLCVFDGGNGLLLGRSIYAYSYGDRIINTAQNAVTYTPAVNVEVRLRDLHVDCSENDDPAFSHVYRDGAGTAAPGARSVGFPRVFEVDGGTFEGGRRVMVGFGGGDGELIVNAPKLGRGAWMEAFPGAVTRVFNPQFRDSNAPYNLAIATSGSPYIKVRGLDQYGTFGAAGPRAIYIFGSGTPTIDITRSETDVSGGALVRVDAGLDLRNVTNNVNASGAILLGDSSNTATNVIGNLYQGALQIGGFVMTNSTGNGVLS